MARRLSPEALHRRAMRDAMAGLGHVSDEGIWRLDFWLVHIPAPTTLGWQRIDDERPWRKLGNEPVVKGPLYEMRPVLKSAAATAGPQRKNRESLLAETPVLSRVDDEDDLRIIYHPLVACTIANDVIYGALASEAVVELDPDMQGRRRWLNS